MQRNPQKKIENIPPLESARYFPCYQCTHLLVNTGILGNNTDITSTFLVVKKAGGEATIWLWFLHCLEKILDRIENYLLLLRNILISNFYQGSHG